MKLGRAEVPSREISNRAGKPAMAMSWRYPARHPGQASEGELRSNPLAKAVSVCLRSSTSPSPSLEMRHSEHTSNPILSKATGKTFDLAVVTCDVVTACPEFHAKARSVSGVHLCLYASPRPIACRSRSPAALWRQSALCPPDGAHSPTSWADPSEARRRAQHRSPCGSRTASCAPLIL